MTFGWSKLCSSWEEGCQSMEKAKMSSQRPPARTRTRTGFTRNYCRKFYKDLEEMISILVAAPFREQNPQYIWQIFVGYPANILWLVKQILAYISFHKIKMINLIFIKLFCISYPNQYWIQPTDLHIYMDAGYSPFYIRPFQTKSHSVKRGFPS